MSYEIDCPAGQMAVGMDLRAADNIFQITRLYCKTPNQIDSSSSGGTATKASAGGGSSGYGYTFKCPVSTAIQSAATSGNNPIRTIAPACANLKTGGASSKTTYGNNMNGPVGTSTKPACAGNNYLTGLYGTSTSTVNTVSTRCADFSSAQSGLYTPAGNVACCMGTIDSGSCTMTPQSPQCDQFYDNLVPIKSNSPAMHMC